MCHSTPESEATVLGNYYTSDGLPTSVGAVSEVASVDHVELISFNW